MRDNPGSEAQRHARMPKYRGYMRNIVIGIIFTGVLAGCASSSSIVVGKVRPGIQPTAVKIYIDPPKSYERVALLESSSARSFARSPQARTDIMIERLKEEAAKIGANGILLTEFGKQQAGGAIFIPLATGGGMMAPAGGEHKTGSGLAIYVTEE